MSKKEYDGKDIKITFDLKKCIHAAECVNGAPEVFDPNKRPWITPDEAPAGKLASVVKKCPTGALKYEMKDGTNQEALPDENSMQLMKNGPIYCSGNFQVNDQPRSENNQESRLALCRCGASNNKPYCDNQHAKASFNHEGKFDNAQPQLEGLDNQSDQVELKVIPNGPILINGPLNIHNSEGEKYFAGKQTALCRCGASNNKPFCDGQHTAIKFHD